MNRNTIMGWTLIVIAAISFVGCNGQTDGGSAAEDDLLGNEFVADDSAGTFSLKCPSSLEVSGTGGFSVQVRDASGGGVNQISVSCDSEAELAIIEPNSGSEFTDDNGQMSGRIGCAAPGSFQLGCRLPNGGGKREFCTVICEGDIPQGFDGFPNSGGGGLGGGVDTPDDGAPGGDSIGGVSIVSLSANDIDSNTRSIDVFFIGDCDGDPLTDDPEPIVQNEFDVTLKNSSNQSIRVTGYTFTVSNVDGLGTGDYTSPRFALNAVIPPNGGEVTSRGVFTTLIGGGKSFLGRFTPISALFRNVTFRIEIRNESDDRSTVSASVGLNFDGFNNC